MCELFVGNGLPVGELGRKEYGHEKRGLAVSMNVRCAVGPLFIAVAALTALSCFGETRVFVPSKGGDRITLKDNGTCSFVVNGRTVGGHYKIGGKLITFDVAGRHDQGFWYGSVIRYPKGAGYKSFSLASAKARRPRRG